MRIPDEPSVLVLLVATDAEERLAETLRGLRAQRGVSMKVLAVDNGSTDATPSILAKAFGDRVVTLPARVGYGRALAEALRAASERDLAADAFLLVHDDAALAPGALAAMVEALRAPEVGIVGAKLVEWDDETALQDIGRTTDRYGRIVERVERGEIDHGQHDGVHEVLYATSAALLVARRVVEEVGLFDVRYVVLRDDLDMCWRARIAGFRTVVTTDAVARHAAATIRDERAGPTRRNIRYFGDRNMIATLLKNYSARSLLIALPVTVLVSVINIVLYAARGRRRSALQAFEALRWNFGRLPSTIRARRRVQRARRVPDSEVTALMHHGASRLRAQIERAVETVVGDVEEVTDEDLEAPPETLMARLRAHPGGVAAFVVAVVALLGARPLLISGAVSGIDMPPFPASGFDFFREYASGWRGLEAGGAGPATPGLVLLGLLTLLCLGSGWLAQRVLLFGLPLLGALGMLRLTRAAGLGRGGSRLAAVLYGASPIMLGAFGAGRLPDLVLLGAAPLLMLPLVRAARVAPRRGWRSRAAGAMGLALTASLSPWALVLVGGVGAVLTLVDRKAVRRVATTTGWMIAGALVLLVPWSLELFRPGSPLGAGGADAPPSMLDLLTLQPGLVHPLPTAVGFGALLAAIAGALRARGPARKVVAALGGAGAVGLLVAYAVARGVPWLAPRPSLPLAATAVAVAVLAGIALDVSVRLLGRRTFGIAHLAAGVLGLTLALQLAWTTAWVAIEERPGLVPARTLHLTSLIEEARSEGEFRVLWLGGTAERPTMGLSGPAGDDLTTFLTRTSGPGLDVARRAAAALVSDQGDAVGRVLGSIGIRFVVVRPDADEAIREAVASHPDLSFSQRLAPDDEVIALESVADQPGEVAPLTVGALLYRNEAGMPLAASIAGAGLEASSRMDRVDVSLAEARPAARGLRESSPGTFVGRTRKGTLAILLAEDHSGRWRARVGDSVVLEPEPSFGWATRFTTNVERADVVVWYAGQRWHRGGVLLNALLVATFLIWRSQRIARDRGEG